MDTNGPFMISGSNFTVSTATENGQNGTFRANGFPAGALSTTSYYEVIITPSAGHKIDFSTFIFDANRGSAGAGPANWSVRVSPYSSDIGTGSLSNGGNADQSSNISSLTGITAATTFRIYFYNGAGDLGLDNVRINGVVTPVAAKTLATFSFASAATPDAGGPSTISVSPVSVTGSPTDVGVTAGVYRTGGAAGWSNNAAGNPDFTQYYEITITPNSGYKIDFQSFIFDFTATDASVGARDWAIRTSPFSSDLGGGTGMTRNVLNINQSADLSSITNATGATVLRLTFFASGNNDVLNLDNVRISGTISAITPTSSLSTLNFSSVTTNSMTANWTPATGTGNTGTNRLVIARLNGAVTASPTDLNTYANNAAFGTVSTDPIVAGDYILYNGTGASVPVTGLGNGEYYYAIYPFNGPGGLERYKTTAPITGRQGTVPSAQPTSITFTSPIATGYTVGWTAVSGVNGYIAIRNAGSSPTDATPATLVNGTSYTVGNALLGGTIAYIGTSASFNETTLTAGTDYFYDIYSYNGTTGNASITYLNSTAPLSGNKIVLSAEPTAAVNTPTFSNITNSTIDVNWTPATTVGGTGANRLVIGRKGGAVTSVPGDGTTYNSNAAFGTVGTDQMVAGDFVV
ncbi:MAG TPA: hypothetical protein PLD84_09805 [Chitinophagales bacterium]|nr:hypothetical protein [Chitinophagales bacterium]